MSLTRFLHVNFQEFHNYFFVRHISLMFHVSSGNGGKWKQKGNEKKIIVMGNFLKKKLTTIETFPFKHN